MTERKWMNHVIATRRRVAAAFQMASRSEYGRDTRE